MSVIIFILAITFAAVIWLALRVRRFRESSSENVKAPFYAEPKAIIEVPAIADSKRTVLESIPVEHSLPGAPAPLAYSGEISEPNPVERRSEPEVNNKAQHVPEQTIDLEKSADKFPALENRDESPREINSDSDRLITNGESDNKNNEPIRPTYRPRIIKPPKSSPRAVEKNPIENSQPVEREQILDVRIQAVFDRYGFCQIRMLGERLLDTEEEVRISNGQDTLTLSVHSDEWYEINAREYLPLLIGKGFRYSTRGSGKTQISWQLGGRDIYVLASQPGFAGYVSTVWLRTGRDDQVVLCKTERAEDVKTVLAESGCNQLEAYHEDYGAPAGWTFFRGVRPQRALTHTPGNDILNILRPLPEINIELSGGLWLYDSVWLAGFPPKISVSGEVPVDGVTIDGNKAEPSANGGFIAPRWDRDGSHVVWCGGRQVTYSIVSPSPEWEAWKPYSYWGGAICGATAAPANEATLVAVPAANRMLLGAKPGEIFQCDERAAAEWQGLVPFKVVWGVPVNVLHSDKKNHHVRLISASVPLDIQTLHRAERSNVWQWCQAILDCRRKGLTLWPGDDDARLLWKSYSAVARRIWRALKQHGTK